MKRKTSPPTDDTQRPPAGPAYGALLQLVGSAVSLAFLFYNAAVHDAPLSEGAVSALAVQVAGSVWTLSAHRRARLSAAITSATVVLPLVLLSAVAAVGGGGCGVAYYEGARQVITVDPHAAGGRCRTTVDVDGRAVLVTVSDECPDPVWSDDEEAQP